MRHNSCSTLVLAFVVLLATSAVHGQTGTKNGEWRTYGHDLSNTRHRLQK